MWFSERLPLRLPLLCVLVALLSSPSMAERIPVPDTLTVGRAMRDLGPQRRMSLSAFPVELKQMGRTLRIKSENSQLLPIYTESGMLYMVMRLAKGTNWLSGLPRGKYFINNHPVTIK